jgi:PAS domain S-box-containing protein
VREKSLSKRPKILLVDDREDNILAYAVALRDVSCDIEKALSGAEALACVTKSEYAVVLLDVQMPEMDGFEAARRIRELPNGRLLPILFVTAGFHDQAIFKKAYASGAIDFLTKPLDADILRSKVNLFIELFAARQIIRSQTESRTFLNGAGQLANMFREKDWAATPLGSLNDWPQSLRTAVGILLQSKIPMFIAWGSEDTFLYNDAYSAVLGKKHPTALGRPFKEVWFEIWHEISPLVAAVANGESVYLEDLLLVMNRYGYDEETYFTFSYSPIRGENGHVEGLFCACVETTEKVKSQQSLKHALDKVEASEQTLDQIFNESPAFMSLVTGPNHVYSKANRKYYEVTGRQDLIGKTVAEIFPEIEAQGIIKILDEVYRSGKPYFGHETPIKLNKAGVGMTELFFDFVYQPLVNPEGRIFGIVGQGSDVTHQVLARRRSEQSDRDLRLALESAKMGTWRIDLHSGMIEMSPQFSELIQVPQRSQLLTEVIDSGVHREDRESTHRLLKQAIEERTPYFNEYRVTGPNGETRWLASRGRVVYTQSGEAVSLSGVSLDITDRKLVEIVLQRNARLVEAMPQPFFAVDGQWNVTFFNPAAAEVLGMGIEEVLGRTLWEAFPDLENSEFGINYKKTYREKVRVNAEAFYPGFQRWYQIWSFPFEDGVAVAFLDITDRKNTENVLAEAKRAAERANALKSAFLANMSHEIRTPLGAMIGFADLLKDPGLEDTERWGYLDIITRNGNQLAHLINDILDLSKVESGHLSFESHPTDPRRIVSEVVSLLNISAKEKNLLLKVSIEPSVAESMTTDSARLKQILVNIIGNAIKFTQVGSIVVRVFAEPDTSDRIKLCFEVTDTGIGIAEDKRERLFQVFTQADESVTRKYGGTGLGLALSKKLANGLGGDVILQRSEEGGGSAFLVTIRDNKPRGSIAIKSGKSAADHRSIEVGEGRDLENLRVLLVEDSPDNQQLIWRILAKKGAKIEIADNGVEGMSMALKGQYDIVLMDIQMPLMDGYTATHRLREHGFSKPILALTAHAMSEVRQKCLQVGCTDHLPKPINAVDLVRMVQKLTF